MAQGVAYRAGLIFLAGGLPGEQRRNIVRWGGEFYRWTGTYYRPVSDEQIKADVTRWLARHPAVRTDGSSVVKPVTESLVRDVMLAVRTEAEINDGTQPGTWVNGPPANSVGPYLSTAAGVFDLGRLGDSRVAPVPNDPNFFALSALPMTPDRTAAHPVWDQFLGETFGGDTAAVRVLQEAFGYCFWPDSRYEKLFVLYGPGGSGKSTLVAILSAMLGETNVSAISLDRLSGRFDLSGLIGKLANVVFDASDVDHAAEGTLKALISGEPVPVENKYQPIRTTRLTAKHFIVTNVLPRFHDTTDGLWRRIVMLPCDRICPLDRRDPSLKARLLSELAAIAGWAMEGLIRLRSQDRFTTFGRGERHAEDYRAESNPVGLFLAARCERDATGRVARQQLYATYRVWAAANGFSPLSVTRFNREVRALLPQPDQDVRDGRGGNRMFVGLRLSEVSGVLGNFRDLASE